MRIKGYALVPKKVAQPMHVDDESMAVALDDKTAEAMGFPGHDDVIMCFRTDDPEWYELLCLTDIPKKCRGMVHLVTNHMDEIEALLDQFKLNKRGS